MPVHHQCIIIRHTHNLLFVCDADSEWQLQNGCIPLTCQEQRPQYRSMSSQEVEKMSSQEVENKFSLFSLLRERKSRLSQKKELNSNTVTTNGVGNIFLVSMIFSFPNHYTTASGTGFQPGSIEGSIDYNTVNTNCPIWMYFLIVIHPWGWINDERNDPY